MRIFNPAHEMPFAGHPDARNRVGARGATPACGHRARDGYAEIVPVELDRDESGALVFGRMEQPVPTISAGRRDGCALRRAGCDRVGASGRAVRQRCDAHRRDARQRGGGRGALARTSSAIARFERHGRQLHRRVRCVAGRAACSGLAERMRRLARPRGRSRVTCAGTGCVEWGEWIEISQGVEIGRPSTLFARADGGDGGIERVFCGGRAVVVARGEFRL